MTVFDIRGGLLARCTVLVSVLALSALATGCGTGGEVAGVTESGIDGVTNLDSGAGSSGSGSSGRTSGTSSPRKTGTTVSTEPAEPVANEDATGGDYTVRFVAQGAEATLECFDGRDKVEFVNATRQTFTGVVTCRVHIDGSMGVVQVKQEGTVACVASGGSVSCAAQ